MSVTREERLRFAEAMMEEAEHSSEIAMRTSLSRAYYALHHLGIEITGASGHGTIGTLLSQRNPRLGTEYAHFLRLRARADYTPPLLNGLDLEAFRETFQEEMTRARRLFDLLKEEFDGAA